MIDRNTAMARLSRGALLLAAVLIFGCGGGDDEGGDGADDGDGGEGTETFTCSASIVPVTFDYVASGDFLEVIGSGTTETWERVALGDPERLVYGTWHVGEETVPGIAVVGLDFLIEPDQVSVLADCDFGSVSGSAQATSAAEITDTSITVLESDEDVQVVTR